MYYTTKTKEKKIKIQISLLQILLGLLLDNVNKLTPPPPIKYPDRKYCRMCRNMGPTTKYAYKNIGPIFFKLDGSLFASSNDCNHGWSHVQQDYRFPKFSECSPCKHSKIMKRKIPKNGYLFLPKWLLKMGKVFECRVAQSRPNLIDVSLPGGSQARRPNNTSG